MVERLIETFYNVGSKRSAKIYFDTQTNGFIVRFASPEIGYDHNIFYVADNQTDAMETAYEYANQTENKKAKQA